MMVACWLLRTPLGALYFNLSWVLARLHPPRLRDFALPISTGVEVIQAQQRSIRPDKN
jgi:hypothetical protein